MEMDSYSEALAERHQFYARIFERWIFNCKWKLISANTNSVFIRVHRRLFAVLLVCLYLLKSNSVIQIGVHPGLSLLVSIRAHAEPQIQCWATRYWSAELLKIVLGFYWAYSSTTVSWTSVFFRLRIAATSCIRLSQQIALTILLRNSGVWR